MKKLLLMFLFLHIILSSCAPKIKIIQREYNVYMMDFREYSKKGFLFTPYSYKGNYISIGIIRFSVRAGAEYKLIQSKREFAKKYDTEKWYKENIMDIDILEYSYKKAIQMGADAICDFETSLTFDEIYTGAGNISLPVLNVNGFAIKRIN